MKATELKLPDWLRGETLDAWHNYFAIRKSKRLMVNDRIIKSRIKELTGFRNCGMDLVKIIDSAAEGNGRTPWLKFYPPKDFVPVGRTHTKIDGYKRTGGTIGWKEVADRFKKEGIIR